MNQIKQINKPEIVRITVFSKDYSLDYENLGSFSTTQKETIETIKNEGANTIFIYTDFNYESDNPNIYLKRINKIAKLAGYESKVELKDMYQEMDGIRKEWKEISGKLIKQ